MIRQPSVSPVVRRGLFIASFALGCASTAATQTTITGLPFLTIPASVESHALGRISVLPTGSALASRSNPSLPAFHAFDVLTRVGAYVPATDWLPGFGSEITFSAQGAQLGIPLSAGGHSSWTLGLGFTRIYLELGDFVRSFLDPVPISTFDAWEDAQTLSCGLAYAGPVTVSVGAALTLVRSNLAPFGTAMESPNSWVRANTWTIGATVYVPVTRLLGLEVDVAGVKPFAALTSAAAISDLGGTIRYSDQMQSDPLPRAWTLGLAASAGVRGEFAGRSLEFLTVELMREAQDILVERSALLGQEWKYQNAPGDLDLFEDLFHQGGNTKVEHRKGFRMTFAESVTVSEGSFVDAGYSRVRTSGLTFSTRAVFLVLRSLVPGNGLVPLVLEHVSVEYAKASYDAPGGHPLSGTDVQSFTFTIHAINPHAPF